MGDPASATAALVAWNFGSWRTIDLHLRIDITSYLDKRELAWDHIQERYVESRTGGRYADSRGMKGDVIVTRTEQYTDGSKAATVNFRPKDAELQRSVIIKREYSDEDKFGKSASPAPIQFFSVGRTPLQEALPKSTDLGTDRVNGRECRTFLFPNVDYTTVRQDLVYYLDAATGTPIKVVSYLDEAHRAKNLPGWSWIADDLKTTQNHEIPAASTMTTYAADGKSPSMIHKFTVESVKYDQEFPTTTFWPVIQPGVPILDALTKKSYNHPGVMQPDPASTVAKESLVATPPRDWSSTTSAVTLGLGLAVLLAGGLLWWRRR